MRDSRLSSLLCSAALILALCQVGAASPNAALAVVRIPSHGASATVIATAPRRSLLLGCAHAFQGADRARPIRLDVPVKSTTGNVKPAVIILLALDTTADLSLLLLNDGPLPYVAPVAPPGHQPGRQLLSIGYDGMRLPAERQPATLLIQDRAITYTRERPAHGRSGGLLLDVDAGYLIGVVHGYEISGQHRGLYVGHAAILRFLAPYRHDIILQPLLAQGTCR
jgi:hypothetical protein